MKNKLIITFMALSLAVLIGACQEEEHKAATTPQLSEVILPELAYFGDSVVFSATVTDQTPLSTLKAYLYFGEDVVGKDSIRTRSSGTYSGKMSAPYSANVPDGVATVVVRAQNIEFGLVEQSFELPVQRPDFPYLTLIADNGEQYTMERTDQYQYHYVGFLPQTLNAYIASPEVSETEQQQGKNQLTWGMSVGKITCGITSPIKFVNQLSGVYEIWFNTKTYEAGPFADPISFGGVGMEMVDDNNMKVELELTQNQGIEVEGINLEGVWVDPDYFTVNNASSLTFLPMNGKYRVTYNTQLNFIYCEAMSGNDLATLDQGALWLIGWGVGKPDPAIVNCNWDTSRGMCMARIDDNVYQITTKLIQGFDFKFFHQKGWGGEFGKAAYAEFSSEMLKITDGGNFQASDQNPPEFGVDYVITIDLSAGREAVKMNFKKKGAVEEDENTVKFAGIVMTQNSETEYVAETRLSQGQQIAVNAVDLNSLWIDPDYFTVSGPKSLKFLASEGKYRVTLDLTLNMFRVEAMNGSSLSTFDDGGSMWMIGWGVGKPDPAVNNINWDTNKGLCMAKIGTGIFQVTTKLTPVTEEDKFSFKFFYQKGWGGEFKGPDFASYQSDLVAMTDGGNFEPLAGATYNPDKYYVITVDASAGINSLVMSMKEYNAVPTFAGTAFKDGVVEVELKQDQDIAVSGYDLSQMWIDPDFFKLNDNGTLKFLPLSGKYRITYMEAAKYFRVETMNGNALSQYDTDGNAIWLIGGKVGKPDAEGDNNVSWNTDRPLCMAQIKKGVFRVTFKLIDIEGDTSFKFFYQKGWGGEFGATAYASYQSDMVKLTDAGNFDQLKPNPVSGEKFYTVTLDTTLGIGGFVMTMKEVQ